MTRAAGTSKRMPSAALSTLTDHDASASFGHERPMLIDISTTWCPPCRALAPVIARIAAERAGTLDVRGLDADASPALASRFQARAFPTLVLFAGGREIWRQVGALPYPRLVSALDAALAQVPQ